VFPTLIANKSVKIAINSCENCNCFSFGTLLTEIVDVFRKLPNILWRRYLKVNMLLVLDMYHRIKQRIPNISIN